MKKISKTVVGVIIGILVAFTIDVAAEVVISSGAVSYSNAATSETTVRGALDELFSAVDINQKIGTTDISSIGDGTITGAINTINSSDEAALERNISDYFYTVHVNLVVKSGNVIKYEFRGLVSKDIPNSTWFGITDTSWSGYNKAVYSSTLNAFVSTDAYMTSGVTRVFAWNDSNARGIFVGSGITAGQWLHINGIAIVK